MHFIIVTGHLCDQDAALIIEDALKDRSLDVRIITDEEFLNTYKPNGYFIISLGGPSVNRLSSRIQELYPRAIDASVYDMPDFCWAYGSKGGLKSNRHKLNNACIALFGPQAEHTLNTAKDFIKDDALLDDIIRNPKSWQTKLVESR